MNHFASLYHTVKTAHTAEQIFGDLSRQTNADLKRCYRQLAQQLHPDRVPENPTAANEAFRLLTQWYQQAKWQVSRHQGHLVILSNKHAYVTTAVPLAGDLCDIYPAKMNRQPVILKIGRTPKNDDLMTAEATALRLLNRQLQNDPLKAHFPTLIEAFKMRDEIGQDRRIHVLGLEPETVTLENVLKAFPNGLHPADAAWMFNRMLVAAAVCHQNGWVHGAILPAHILLRPSDHNAVLLDFCYSVPIGKGIKAVSPAYKSHYPIEVWQKQAATPATDIYMTAVAMLKLLGGDINTFTLPNAVPPPIAAFLRGCLIQSPHRRPTDAWELFDEFHTILGKLYGPPRFRPFVMPSNVYQSWGL